VTSTVPDTEIDIEGFADGLVERGYAAVPGLASPDFVAEIREEIERLETLKPGGDIPPYAGTGYHTVRFFNLLHESEVWQRVAAHPPVLAIIKKVLGDDLQLSTMGTAIVGPGEDDQPLHADDRVYGPLPREGRRELVCNTVWALSDFNVDTGATRFVPGSQHFPGDPGPDSEYSFERAIMPAGGIAFILGRTFHGAGANRSDERRYGLTINYCDSSMRTQENLALSTAHELPGFSRPLQDMLGYRMSNYATGHIGADDPRKVLERQAAAR
jgi:ectoine hydroxylase-related dioxygenase (phytanoyl-CoA dioxygenase family)